MLFHQEQVSVLSAGLEPGERVVISDLVPAVEGMLLRPQPDAAAAERVRVAAGVSAADSR